MKNWLFVSVLFLALEQSSFAQTPSFVRARIDSVNPNYHPQNPTEWLVFVEAEIFDANLNFLSPLIASAYRWYVNICNGQGWQFLNNVSGSRLGYDGHNFPTGPPHCCLECNFQAFEIRVEVDISGQTYTSASIRVPDDGSGELIGTRGVVIDQTRENGSSFGQIGRFDFGHFHYYPVPYPFGFRLGSETLKASQEILSSPAEKHIQWSNIANVKNHQSFPIDQNLPRDLNARFKSVEPGIKIKSLFLDNTAINGVVIRFRDPWFIDFVDAAFDNQPRNRGMNEAVWYTRQAPSPDGFKPDFNTQYPEGTYKGVFMVQEIAPGLPYYRVGAPLTLSTGSFPSVFAGWATTGAIVGCATCPETSVVFQQPNAEVTAQYKYKFRTFSPGATSYNNQRKLVTDYYPTPIVPPPATHLVYDSAGFIKYASTTTGGISWGNEQTFGYYSFYVASSPTIDVLSRVEEHPIIMYQNNIVGNPGYFEIWGHARRYRNWQDPPGGPYIWDYFSVGYSQYLGSEPAKPVLAFPFAFFLHNGGSTPGYYYSISEYGYWAASSFFSNYAVRVPSDMPSSVRNLSAIRSVHYGSVVDTIHIAWEENNSIKYRRVVGSINQSPQWFDIENLGSWKTGSNKNPSICVDYVGRPSVAWEWNDYIEEEDGPTASSSRQIRTRRREASGWGVVTAFSALGRDFSHPSISRFATTVNSNDLALAWQTDESKVRVTWLGDGWEGVQELPEVSGAPTTLGFQQQGSQLLAFTSPSSPNPIGIRLYPPRIQTTPLEERMHERYREVELATDNVKVSFAIGNSILSTNDSTRGVRFRRLPDTTVIRNLQDVGNGLASESFSAPRGSTLSSYVRLRVAVRDSLIPLPRNDKVHVKLLLVRAGSGEIIAHLQQFIIQRNSPPRFRGRTEYRFRGTEGEVQLVASFQVTGNEEWLPHLVVHHRDGNMPGDSIQFLSARYAKAATPAMQSVPTQFELHPTFPNPFNPSTQITFDLPEPSHVSLVVYDVLGRKVAELENGIKEAGYHSTTWNASDVASGVYFARFTATDANGNVKLAKVSKLLLTK